jgi:hypothetical protein
VEPDSTAGFKQRALVKMKETAKALARNNKNELPAARTLEVSLDRADNVIDGWPTRLHRVGDNSEHLFTRWEQADLDSRPDSGDRHSIWTAALGREKP